MSYFLQIGRGCPVEILHSKDECLSATQSVTQQSLTITILELTQLRPLLNKLISPYTVGYLLGV